MSERKDITRWNRAGLSQFRYIDGNAAEYLEILRKQLFDKFKDGENNICEWLYPAEEIPVNEIEPENKIETITELQERLNRTRDRIQQMYYRDRQNYVWEIVRTFARACHILTEHVNTYTNEGFLGTATQWDNVRKLVEMLDYHPAPPASAYTRLALIAKDGKSGLVEKGFKVQYTPENGDPKIVFETLDDINIDSKLNELRSVGWNKSDDPPILGDIENEQTVGQPPSTLLAESPVIALRGIGEVFSTQLNSLTDSETFKIKDFLTLDPSDPGFEIDQSQSENENRRIKLSGLKARAISICEFYLDESWSKISDWYLTRITSETPDVIIEQTGKSLNEVKALQLKIELIGSYLDNDVYKNTKLENLISFPSSDKPSVRTQWKVKQKPKISAGQVTMILKQTDEEIIAEGATVRKVDEKTNNIHLCLDQVNYSWTRWKKSEIVLYVSPRWKRKCWLNGDDVIRTVDPHGLSAGSYICWKIGYKLKIGKVLIEHGCSLVSIAIKQVGETDKVLSIRIFDEDGNIVGQKSDDANETDPQKLLHRKDIIDDLKRLDPELDENSLSEKDYQDIIDKAIFCSSFTQWNFAKINEADKWSLRLDVKRTLPRIGTKLFVLRPIEGPVFPENYEAVVILGRTDELLPVIEKVTPNIQELPKEGVPSPLFTLKEVLAPQVGGGGGLLPPASLPKIGCFLFPSPMLPVELVKAAVELMLSLGVMAIPSTGDIVIKGMPFGGILESAGNNIDLAVNSIYNLLNGLKGIIDNSGLEKNLVEWHSSLKANAEFPTKEAAIKDAITKMLSVPKNKEATTLFQKLTEDITGTGPLLAIPKEAEVKAEVKDIECRYMFDGSTKIEIDDWVVGDFTDGLRALSVKKINWFTENDKTETFSLSFPNQDLIYSSLKQVYADFRGSIIAEGAEKNTAVIKSEEIELKDLPDNLKIGKEVLLTADKKDPVIAKIERIDGNTITTNPPATDFTFGELKILANVVMAGHGERKPEKILGSGNAMKSNQEFILDVKGVSFIPDATKRSGIAAAVEVNVENRTWEQVSSLKDSGPGDHHYEIRMTEEGYVKFIFGDGDHGCRLPSGKNNIRVRYRVGSGLTGNVPPGSLEKPVNINPFIKEVIQPFRAEGGCNLENIHSLRENAPATLLTFERAVSLTDYSNLAASHGSVWQAKAFSQIIHNGRKEIVRVVIVPAGGYDSEDIRDKVKKFIQNNIPPGVRIFVDPFKSRLINLSVTLRVKVNEFVAEVVRSNVISELKNHFALENRKLGENLYLSEIYKVVESIEGVENSSCVLDNDKTLQVISPEDESFVVYLDIEKGSTLDVSVKEYTL